jgi:hypothetical protein
LARKDGRSAIPDFHVRHAGAGRFQITGSEAIGNVRLLDITGRLLDRAVPVPGQVNTWQLRRPLPSGITLLRFRHGRQWIHRKIATPGRQL